MNRYVLTAALGAAMLPATPALARDARAFTLHSTVLLAGPERDYPRLRRLPDHTGVTVYGCLDDRSWCDVSWRTYRGWVEGADLAISYRGRYTALRDGLGIGVLSFSFGSYWDDHYRTRSFYEQRSQWESHGNRSEGGQWTNQPGGMRDGGGEYRPGAQPSWQQRQPGGPLERTIPGAQAPRPRNWQPLTTPDRTMPVPRQDLPMATMPTAPVAGTAPVGPARPTETGERSRHGGDQGNGNTRRPHAD